MQSVSLSLGTLDYTTYLPYPTQVPLVSILPYYVQCHCNAGQATDKKWLAKMLTISQIYPCKRPASLATYYYYYCYY